MGSTDDKVARMLLGTLLSSNLTLRELRAFASALQRDPAYARRLGSALDSMVELLMVDDARRSRAKYQIISPEQDFAERIYNMLESHNITTAGLLTLIREVHPMPDWTPASSWSKRKIVESFLAAAPAHVVGKLVQKVIGDEDVSDPYLSGLLKRGEG